MSKILVEALNSEKTKLVRQIANRDSTVGLIEILGDDLRRANNLVRQEDAIMVTEKNIKVIETHLKKLSK